MTTTLIRMSPERVAFMVKVAAHFGDLQTRVFESPGRIRNMAAGATKPSDAVLKALRLERAGDAYLFRLS